MSLPLCDTEQLPESTSDTNDTSAFQSLLHSSPGCLSPSVASTENGNTIPLLELATHAQHDFRRLSRRKSHWPDSFAQQSSFLSWLNGTLPCEKRYIKPMFPQVAAYMQGTATMLLPGRSLLVACGVVILLWAMIFTLILASTYGGRPSLPEEQAPVRIACETRLWRNTTFCGLDGTNCAPFLDKGFTFICPAQCASVQVLEPHTIGDQEVIYRNMVIGGVSSDKDQSNIYRGDSFICQAAIHAGAISNRKGGCGILTRVGEGHNFVGTQSNGISSIGFEPSFPLAYTISATSDRCVDPQWKLLTLSVVATVLVSFLATTPQLFVTLTLTISFFQIALASDRPFHPELSGLVSMAFERFLPTVFVIYTMCRFCHALGGMHTHIERTLFWTGGCWVGALNNYTFDRLPISRLTIHDLQQQPGAAMTLVIIIAIIAMAAIGQIVGFRAEGRLLRYVCLYLVVGLFIGILALVPTLQLRLHHYILALVLLPGTSIQTRRSLFYQGLLFGLFISGIARWGYASILQTADSLREDGQLGSALPEILSADIVDHSTIRFTIESVAKGFDGISMLVNDVERYRTSPKAVPTLLNWTRTSADIPTFFRFAFTSSMPLGGTLYGDYTKTGTWHSNGTWEMMRAGPSK